MERNPVRIVAAIGVLSLASILSHAQRGPVRIVITPNQSSVALGTTAPLHAQMMFFRNSGSGKDISSAVKWSASPAIATINSSGVLTPSNTGTTLITAVSGPFRNTAWVTIVPSGSCILSGVTVAQPTFPSGGLPNGLTQQFQATANFTDTTNCPSQDVTDTCQWMVSSATNASINTSGPAAGVATAHAPHAGPFPINVTVTASYTFPTTGGVTKSGTATLTIGPPAQTGIAITPAINSLPLHLTPQFQLQLWGLFSDNATQSMSPGLATWSSSNTSLATVDNSGTSKAGTINAVGLGGPVTITANFQSFTPATTQVTVVPHTLDAYGGINSVKCTTATGFFHVEKIQNQWWFCTPNGNGFFMVGVYVVAPDRTIDAMGSSYDARIKIKYGDDGPSWAKATNQRLLSWGFNALGTYNNAYTLATTIDQRFPLDALGLHSQPIKMPFISIVRPAFYSSINSLGPDGKTRYLSEAVKDMMFGHSPGYSGAIGNPAYVPANGVSDYFDTSDFTGVPTRGIDVWLNSELMNTYFNSPWKTLRNSPYLSYMLGVNCDDSDEMYGFGSTPDFTTTPVGHNNNNLGWIIASMTPVQTANANKAQVYTSVEVETKIAWMNYLKTKYSTISALNTAWGSNYTSTATGNGGFGSSGSCFGYNFGWCGNNPTAAAESYGAGNGSTTTFAHTLAHLTPSKFSVEIKVAGVAVAGDTGNGKMYGPTLSTTCTGCNTINYSTGAVTITFKTAPTSGQAITVSYIQNGWGIGTGVLDEDARASHQAWTSNNYYTLTGANANFKIDTSAIMEQTAEHYFKTCHDGIKAAFPNNLYMGPDSLSTWSIPSRTEVLQAANKYIDVMITGGQVSFTQAMIDYTEASFGDKPYIEGEFRTANVDSALFNFSDSSVGGFPSQANRAKNGTSGYFDVLSTIQNRAGTNGNHPYIGTEWWQFVDNWGEKLNWGLVSSLDNVYDGKEAIISAGTDPFGFPTGGELKNYGDMLTNVKAANVVWINTH